MSTDPIELDDLSKRRATSAEPPLDRDQGTSTDGSISVWAWTSAAVLALFSICLVAFPRLLLFLAEPADGRNVLTSLERYLAFQLGVILGVLAITIVAVLPSEWPTNPQRKPDPNWHPFLRPVTAASLLMAFLSYDNRTIGALATTVLLGSSFVGLFGLWMLVFSAPPPISRKTGTDKHAPTFIFGSKSAASFKKRLWPRNRPT